MKGIVAADIVWDGVGVLDILEATGVDLVVIVGVAPRAKAVIIGVGKDRRVAEARGI